MGSIGVLGGRGFIGRRLTGLLRDGGHHVRTVDVVAATGDGMHRMGDVRDWQALTAALDGTEIVYNLAAAHRDDVKPVSLYQQVNVAGAANVCRACRELGIDRLVFTSSAAVYGSVEPYGSEGTAPEPLNAYGRSKLEAERIYRAWQAEAPARRSLVIVRPTVVFGEGNRGNVYQLLRQIMARRFVMVGDGRNRKSMAYVGNVSAFLMHVLGLGAGTHLFNYADGPDLSMGELVQIVLTMLGRSPVVRVRIPYPIGYLGGVACDALAAVTGRRLPISAVRIRKFCSTTTFSTDRMRGTGFLPPIGLREALERTIRHELSRRESAASDADG